MAAPATSSKAFTRVPAESLFVSEPPPDWFGNPPNERGNAAWTNANWFAASRAVAWGVAGAAHARACAPRLRRLKSRFHFNFAGARRAAPPPAAAQRGSQRRDTPPRTAFRAKPPRADAAPRRAEHTGGRGNLGVLRVCNDDLVQPARGFGTHPHRDAEIATYVVSGELTHKARPAPL